MPTTALASESNIPSVIENSSISSDALTKAIADFSQDENVVSSYSSGLTSTVNYKVSEEELTELQAALAEVQAGGVMYYSSAGTAATNKYTTSSKGSFKKSDVAGIAAALSSKFLITSALSIASILYSNTKGNTIYYNYTQTSWNDANGFHVKVNIKFYRDAAHRSYITQTNFNRNYVLD